MLPLLGFTVIWLIFGTMITCTFAMCELFTLGSIFAQQTFGHTLIAGFASSAMISLAIMLAAQAREGRDHGDR